MTILSNKTEFFSFFCNWAARQISHIHKLWPFIFPSSLSTFRNQLDLITAFFFSPNGQSKTENDVFVPHKWRFRNTKKTTVQMQQCLPKPNHGQAICLSCTNQSQSTMARNYFSSLHPAQRHAMGYTNLYLFCNCTIRIFLACVTLTPLPLDILLGQRRYISNGAIPAGLQSLHR